MRKNVLITPIAMNPAVVVAGQKRWVRGALVGAFVTSFVLVPAGVASAAPNGSTDANVVVGAGIALQGLPASVTLTGIPGDIAEETAPFTYTVVTNSTSGYTVTVEAAADVLLPADTVANTDSIPIARLGAQDETGGAPGGYAALSDTAPVLVHTQPVRSGPDGDTLATGFQMDIPAVNPDTYTVTLNYLAAVI